MSDPTETHGAPAVPVAPSAAEQTSNEGNGVRVLVVDDEPRLRRSIVRILMSRGFVVDTAQDGVAGLAALAASDVDVALVDLMMPNMGGLEMLRRSKEKRFGTEIIMMTAFADVESAVSAVKLGAYHFLTKPFQSNDAVALTVSKAAEHKRLLERAKNLEERLEAREQFGEIIGTSPQMAAVYRLIEGVATATSTVLILGESGTGKELVARAIHQRSARASRPFVAVNCAAIPKDLVESELFGHVRGAFTGAQSARAGLFESAHMGTIFLDEVGDLPLAAQVKLLRTLQEGEVKRVGSDETRTVDVRVLAATNVDLNQKIAAGSFRKDLYYRLNVIAIALPPLRERTGDVELLAYHFLQKYARRMGREVKRVNPAAMGQLLAYHWPGNVRELEHAVEHAVVLARGEEILPEDLPIVRARTEVPPPMPEADGLRVLPTPLPEADLPYPEAKRRALDRFDRAYVKELLRRTGGNLSEAARQAGLDRSNFRRIVRKAK
jgi:DNA-binding NtrC family response regulator